MRHMNRLAGLATRASGAAILAVLSLGGASAHASEAALMPLPVSATVNAAEGQALAITGRFAVRFEGFSDARLQRAVSRFQTDINALTGAAPTSDGPALVIAVSADPAAGTLEAKEAYSLKVTEGGVHLTAAGQDGVLRGLATLRQLVQPQGAGFVLPYAQIEDSPRFPWRGLMVDTARHFVELDTLKRQIDAMERVKLNVLHFHFSDNEGFRIESLRYPRLTEISSHGQYYTQAQVRELVAYAADRGIRVVPELDVPAHTGAIMIAYPELKAAPFDETSRLAMFRAAVDPTKPETFAFIKGLLEEMIPLFPDAYFHVGGDEVAPTAWTANPDIVAYMAANGYEDTAALQDHFFRQVNEIVRSLGKTTMGWEEVAHLPIDDDVVVQAWRSSHIVGHITGQNNRAVVSAGYYLDLLWDGLDHYSRDPLDTAATLLDKPEEQVGPGPEVPLNDHQKALVLGAEAPLWSEAVTDEMVDHRFWPRAALLAERFWSPESVRDPVDAMRRAVPVQEALRIQGLQDLTRRQRMAARLAPHDAEAVEILSEVTVPVRNMGRLAEVFAAVRSGRPVRLPSFTAPVDIAGADSLEIYRLSVWADAVAKGEAAAAGPLRAALQKYRDNHPRFVAAAQGVDSLEQAVPLSEEVARLAVVGLEAIDLKTRGARPTAAWTENARALLAKQAQAAEASSSSAKILMGVPQPPALLLVGLTPVIDRLVSSVSPRP